MTESENFDADDIGAYDYELPIELIADHPPEQRESARLLLVDREQQKISFHTIADLPDLLSAGDLLVINNTRVLPARLRGFRAATGGKWEGLFLRSGQANCWEMLGQTRGSLKAGETILIPPPAKQGAASESAPSTDEPLTLTIVQRGEEGVLAGSARQR